MYLLPQVLIADITKQIQLPFAVVERYYERRISGW